MRLIRLQPLDNFRWLIHRVQPPPHALHCRPTHITDGPVIDGIQG